MDENPAPRSIAAGGGTSALDMTSPKDQAALRTAVKRWPKRFAAITDERKRVWVEGLDEAGKVGRALAAMPDPIAAAKGADLLISTARTGGALEGMNQKDEHVEAGVENPGGMHFHGPAQIIIQAPDPATAKRIEGAI